MTAGEKQPEKPEDLKLPVRFVFASGEFEDGHGQHLATMRGWGWIHKLFPPDEEGLVKAEALQGQIADYLVHCINSHASMAKEIEQLRDERDIMRAECLRAKERIEFLEMQIKDLRERHNDNAPF